MRKANYLTLALAVALSACGGGGGNTPAANFDEFYGTWKVASGTCTQEKDSWAGGRYYYNNAVTSATTKIESNSYETKVTYYSDSACSIKAGVKTVSGTLKWSQGSVAGRSNVARISATDTGYQFSADGGTGLSLSSVPQTGSESKSLIDIVDGKNLCFSNNTSSSVLDKDGYPTTFPDTPTCLIR